MTTTDQDSRALAHLAVRLRAELGLAKWDLNGTAVITARLVGTPLDEACHRVIGHACDAEARTPAAIQRPFVPAVTPRWRPDVIPAKERCTTCSKRRPDCERVRHADDDHAFAPAVGDHKRPPEAMAAIVQDARAQLATSHAQEVR